VNVEIGLHRSSLERIAPGGTGATRCSLDGGRKTMTPGERYSEVVRALLGQAEVIQEGRGFGSSALKMRGSIFAMLSSKDTFVVKLPRRRVDELVATGEGERYDPGHGRLMKEWLALDPTSTLDWLTLANEAREFVASRRR
jgi:hypothetical protein